MSRPSAFAREVNRIQVLKLLPGDQISKTDPFVVFIELHSAALIEVIKPDLRRCAGSIHGILLAFWTENARVIRSTGKYLCIYYNIYARKCPVFTPFIYSYYINEQTLAKWHCHYIQNNPKVQS